MGILGWLFGNSDKKKKSNKSQLSPLEIAENKLAVTFAFDYRTNMVCFPISYKYATILGLSPKHPCCDVVTTTKYVRSIYKFIPLDMYVVADLGIDNYYMLQNKQGEIFECHTTAPIRKAFNSLADYIDYLEKHESKSSPTT